jgi:hypothetical protein
MLLRRPGRAGQRGRHCSEGWARGAARRRALVEGRQARHPRGLHASPDVCAYATCQRARSGMQQPWRRRRHPPFVECDCCHCVHVGGHVLQPPAARGACTQEQAGVHPESTRRVVQLRCACRQGVTGTRVTAGGGGRRTAASACAPVCSATTSATSCSARSGRSVRLPANCSMLTPGANQCSYLQEVRQRGLTSTPPSAGPGSAARLAAEAGFGLRAPHQAARWLACFRMGAAECCMKRRKRELHPLPAGSGGTALSSGQVAAGCCVSVVLSVRQCCAGASKTCSQQLDLC